VSRFYVSKFGFFPAPFARLGGVPNGAAYLAAGWEIAVSDLIANRMEWLAAKRRERCTSIITYRRGRHVAEVLASVGKTEFERADGDGYAITSQSRDFLITAVDLVLNNQCVRPEAGDQISETVGDTVYVHEVTCPDQNEGAWGWADSFHRVLRIHTKQVGTE
jgi:hypothetical protein